MRVDVERLKRLYEEYGSLENAVSAKQRELESAAGELKRVQDVLRGETQKLESVRREAEKLEAEVEAVRRLREMGYDPVTLRLLVESTESCGGIEAMLKRLTQMVELSKLDGEVELKRNELRSLDSEVEWKRAELNGLNKTLESQKKLKENLENSISTLRMSLKALNDAVEELKPEVSRLKGMKSKLESQLQTLNQQIDSAKEHYINLKGEIEGLEKNREELENLIKNLTKEANTLKVEAEAKKKEIELSKAIITLMNAKTLEDIKQFRIFVEKYEEYIAKQPRSEEYIEAAKRLIVKSLTPKFAAYECSNCHTRFAIDLTNPVDERLIDCPVCHFSSTLYLNPSLFRPQRSKDAEHEHTRDG